MVYVKLRGKTVYSKLNLLDLPIPALGDLPDFHEEETPIIKKMHQEEAWHTPPESNDAASSSTAEEQQDHEEQKALNQWFRDLDHITITRALEKEGFLFKHINYQLESEKMGYKVLRRFSDFWWLWEVLLKRYPFRMIPTLPPKKLGGSKEQSYK